jgi:hypothetical protein
MSAVSETIVREYFELHGFLVRQERKFIVRGREMDDGIDFVIWNPRPRKRDGAMPFLLSAEHLESMDWAIVVVCGWHTETFTPGTLENSPEIFRFLEPRVIEPVARAFGARSQPMKLLILPSLPQTGDLREQSIQLLRARGIDAVIPFRTMLGELIASTETNRNYEKSDLLQVIRVLKNYGFLREPQMELFKPPRQKKVKPEEPAGLFGDPPTSASPPSPVT